MISSRRLFWIRHAFQVLFLLIFTDHIPRTIRSKYALHMRCSNIRTSGIKHGQHTVIKIILHQKPFLIAWRKSDDVLEAFSNCMPFGKNDRRVLNRYAYAHQCLPTTSSLSVYSISIKSLVQLSYAVR